MLRGGNLIGRGVGDIVEVDVGHIGRCKGRLVVGGVFRDEVSGGKIE